MINFKGIYAVLSLIWKCRKLCVFGANFLGQKIGWCLFYAFLQLCAHMWQTQLMTWWNITAWHIQNIKVCTVVEWIININFL